MLVINGSTCLSPNVPMFVNKVSPKSRYIYTCFDLLSIIATAVTKSFYSEPVAATDLADVPRLSVR